MKCDVILVLFISSLSAISTERHPADGDHSRVSQARTIALKTYTCLDGTLIPQSMVCDFIDDCPDRSDEYGCGPCHFEQDACGWEDLSIGFYSWSRVRGNVLSATSPSAPGFDHTTNAGSGWYMNVAGDMGDFFDVARLRSPSLPKSSSQCEVIFYYWLVGNNTDTFSLFSSTNNTPLWTQSRSEARQWIRVIVPVGANPTGWRLRFELEPNFDHIRDLNDAAAIDDIQFSKCAENQTQHVLDCDFEDDMCAWQTDGLADFNWIRSSGSTPTLDTGPSGDHTTGLGWYIYIETSLPQKPGDRAWLASPMLPPTTFNCLTSYFHMFGADIHRLSVILQTLNENITIFTRNGPQGNVWRQGQINFQSPISYRIIFEGIVGNDWMGDIALDDIGTSPGFCPNLDECDFEDGWCAWQNGTQSDFHWQRGRNGSTSSGTPTVDHTSMTGMGYFLYVESNGRIPGDEAHLVSPSHDGNQSRCLRFWYHLYGEEQGTLRIEQQPDLDESKILWSKSNGQDNLWRPARVTIPPVLVTNAYKILLVGVVGTQTTGDIAIDDISNQEGQCPNSTICTFEEDFCEWVNALDTVMDNFDWIRNSGPTNSLDTGPSVDHTLGTATGNYLYIEASYPQTTGDRAWLISEYYDPGQYCLIFWYHLYGLDIGTLNIWTRIGSSKLQLEWSLSGDQGDQWTMGAVNVQMNTSFTFLIEALVGEGFLGDIAIDDVSVIPNSACTIPTTTTSNGGLSTITTPDTEPPTTSRTYTGPTITNTLSTGSSTTTIINTGPPTTSSLNTGTSATTTTNTGPPTTSPLSTGSSTTIATNTGPPTTILFSTGSSTATTTNTGPPTTSPLSTASSTTTATNTGPPTTSPLSTASSTTTTTNTGPPTTSSLNTGTSATATPYTARSTSDSSTTTAFDARPSTTSMFNTASSTFMSLFTFIVFLGVSLLQLH